MASNNFYSSLGYDLSKLGSVVPKDVYSMLPEDDSTKEYLAKILGPAPNQTGFTQQLPTLTDGGVKNVAPTTQTPTQPQATINGQTVDQYSAGQVTNPTLAAGTTQTYTPIQENQNEIIDESVANVPQTPEYQAAQTQTSTVDPNQLQQVNAAQYNAETGQAEQGTVTPESTIKYQMSQLMDDVQNGRAPWADAAMRKANAAMLARGLGSSSMAGAAIAQSVLEAALPIAEFDAKVFGDMNIQNLRNRQESMLTNQAALNAAKQFNATSENEINKFMSDLTSRVMTFNAEQRNAMERFDVDQVNSVKMFYDKMQNETDKFIAQNKLAIAKSNAEWRRATNLANTAGINATNTINVQNRFNMSQQAVADLWQRNRDAFHWAQTSGENEKDRALRLTLYALQRNDYLDDLSDAESKNFFGGLANVAFGVIGEAAEDFDFDSLFGGSSGAGDGVVSTAFAGVGGLPY